MLAELGVNEYSLVHPDWAVDTAHDDQPHRFTGKDLAALARRLPTLIASVKQRCGDRELVIVAAVPSSLALAVGWALVQNGQPFFSGTHLLQHDARTASYRPVRVHPSQPVDPSTRRPVDPSTRTDRRVQDHSRSARAGSAPLSARPQPDHGLPGRP